ncbi:MAG: (2Fe-2S) ferredoxin domain-containing protein [Deferribacteres bacterium]|nr:(2Fe-2S) ferredoxin domain-containing protein [candidate division KSB1 bacterium]MCB9502370.1 (2Fe-2S) ferredoxin domain-containing protein [Deferribacteres bacterium]
MELYEKHIFVCINERPADNPKGCCFAKDALSVFQKFRAEITARNLKGKVQATKSGCLASCETGPNIVIYPEGVWYKEVTENDVEEIMDEHIIKGNIVERLRRFPA